MCTRILWCVCLCSFTFVFYVFVSVCVCVCALCMFAHGFGLTIFLCFFCKQIVPSDAIRTVESTVNFKVILLKLLIFETVRVCVVQGARR